jgi:RHS repeat-associated protein
LRSSRVRPQRLSRARGGDAIIKESGPGGTSVAGVYDSGTVSLTINGTEVVSTAYGAGSTPASIASGLVASGSKNGLVTLKATGSNLTMTAIDDGAMWDYSYSINVASNSQVFADVPSFAASPASGSLVGGGSAPLYNWAISSYAPDGNVLTMTDKVMGGWSYTYDDMNRLTSGTATGGQDEGLLLTWQYDRYGNRWNQTASTAPGYNPPSGDVSAVQPQLTFTGNNNRIDGWLYDAAGNLLYDYIHHYTYDAENRVATIDSAAAYIYDAEGTRVAKYGSGGALTASYVLGLGGEQISEVNGAGAWMHSNVFVGGRLMATYEGPGGTAHLGYHYHLTDWLGTKRMQTNASGNQEEICYSYPFGDGLSCTGTDATEHHFTGKERDTESGLDYFGARYLSSNLGRFMTPDWAAGPTDVPYASFGNPQSLNLYAYVHNNPNTGIDLDGHMNGNGNVGEEGYYWGEGPIAGPPPPSSAPTAGNSGPGSGPSAGGASGTAPLPTAPNPPVKNPDPQDQVKSAGLGLKNLAACTTEFFGSGFNFTLANLPNIDATQNLKGAAIGETRASMVPEEGRATILIDKGSYSSMSPSSLAVTYMHEAANARAIQQFTQWSGPGFVNGGLSRNDRARLGPMGNWPSKGQQHASSGDHDIGNQFERCLNGSPLE